VKNNSIKAILFDMDGVVIDSEKLYSQSETNVLSNYGIKFDDSDWQFVKGCTEKQFYDHVYLKYNPQVPRSELIIECREFLKKLFSEKLEYMAGFKEVQLYLKEKFKLALVTSTGPELVSHIDEMLGIRNNFNLVITSLDTRAHKPQPDPYLKAMNSLGFLPNQCIVVEDSVQGIKSGKAAGCQVIALEGSLERDLLVDADYIISSLHEIQKIV
tara:strand:+ start:5190 stop:5831 length:642 start_codon:yes stop_codon:yes gene_type:complete